MSEEREEYTVWAFLPDGRSWAVVQWVDVQTAMNVARRVTQARLGAVARAARIIVTDGGDSIVFEWWRDKGVTWPPEAA